MSLRHNVPGYPINTVMVSYSLPDYKNADTFIKIDTITTKSHDIDDLIVSVNLKHSSLER